MSAAPTERNARANIVFAEKDRALKEDVHWLGELVGELVREQGGEALFDLVEAARRAAIAYRNGDDQSLASLEELLSTLAPNSARDFVRAFSTYFQMVNMAEKVHRIRRRRAYLTDSARHQPFSFLDVLTRLRDSGVTADEAEQLVAGLSIEPVFTGQSTEATRRTLLRKQQSIAKHLIQMLDPYLTNHETASAIGQIRMEMTTGWQTAEHPGEPKLSDEAEHVLYFLTDVLYRMIPPFFESLETAFSEVWSDSARRVTLPSLVSFSTWVGGDMDGNPDITAKSMRETLGRQRQLILDRYYRECRDLGRHLSQTEGRSEVSDAVRKQSDLYAGHFPQAAYTVPARHSGMPYRVYLRLVQARLQATYDDTAFPYETPEEFIDDIELIADSLRANKGRNAGLFAVKRLLRRARTFGFHLATLDMRQSAAAHRRVVAAALEESDWFDRSSAERMFRIRKALERRESPVGTLVSDARRTLAVFQTIAHTRRRYGAHGVGSYIVSGVKGPDDILSVLLLARWGHLGPKRGAVALDVAPHFETAEDLANAASIMERLLADDYYREHLRNRNDQQLVMLGYAGGERDGDVLSARWNVHKAERALAETMSQHGVSLALFHGRGGAMNHPSGRVTDALSTLPAAAISGRLRMTEAGEKINEKYGLRGIAMRTLEQLASSLLWARGQPAPQGTQHEQWQGCIQAMAEASSHAYRNLIFDAKNFPDYFRMATPIDVIERIGVGPKNATAGMSPIKGVHEVPWSFAWTQTRCVLPGWYGFASGLDAAIARFGIDEIRKMYREWPFFRLIVADIETTLAKADLHTANKYSRLSGDLHVEFFPRIEAEYLHAVELTLQLTDQSDLLESADTLARSIKLRNPYVDPMNLLQVDLLKRWRAADCDDDAILSALFSSVNGIAHAMQDST